MKEIKCDKCGKQINPKGVRFEIEFNEYQQFIDQSKITDSEILDICNDCIDEIKTNTRGHKNE